METIKKYLNILKINENATLETIRKAYLSSSKKTHPDKNNENEKSESKFKQVVTAYKKLTGDYNFDYNRVALAEFLPFYWKLGFHKYADGKKKNLKDMKLEDIKHLALYYDDECDVSILKKYYETMG